MMAKIEAQQAEDRRKLASLSDRASGATASQVDELKNDVTGLVDHVLVKLREECVFLD